MRTVRAKAWTGLVGLGVFMGAAIFGPAGTVHYRAAWAYLAIFFGASVLITLYLLTHDPALLARRLRAGPTAETDPRQQAIMLVASVGFLAVLVVPALNHRFQWSVLPLPFLLAGDLLTVLSFGMSFWVFRANTFAGATVKIAADQHVIATGPYAVVRHPMYAGGALLFLGTPLALGSGWGLVAFVVTLPALLARLSYEEQLLSQRLPGYREYCAQVRWRLIPGVY
jgi:protein-S-isoprenylcysteine O-methyltransferase Ste14